MHPILEVEDLFKSYDGGQHYALSAVSFSVAPGTICAVIGESGSGKTTLLRSIAGLETPEQGHIRIAGRTVSSLQAIVPPQQRQLGMVFQDFGLFPHLSVLDNIAYGLPKGQKQAAKQWLDFVALAGYGQRYPHELSGGQQQRVAIARALAPEPRLLLMDEPFSNLDAALKLSLRQQIRELLKKAGVSALFITHDPLDAVAIADRAIFLQAGRLIEQGDMARLYAQPETDYVKGVFAKLRESAAFVLRELGEVDGR